MAKDRGNPRVVPKGITLSCQVCRNKIRPWHHRKMYKGKLIHNTDKCIRKVDQCLI